VTLRPLLDGATAGVLGLRDAVTAGLFREPGADIVVTDLADLLGGKAAR